MHYIQTTGCLRIYILIALCDGNDQYYVIVLLCVYTVYNMIIIQYNVCQIYSVIKATNTNSNINWITV